jgi:predicted amidophosphoribosyltransferase
LGIGELVYQLKYNHSKDCVTEIVDIVTSKISGFETFDIIVPAPPSKKNRPYQPVEEIAKELGSRYNIKVIQALEKTTDGTELKGVRDVGKKMELLSGNIQLTNNYNFSGKRVLLLDDLFDSGATLKVATQVIYDETKADKVCVLTMTKTGKG